MSSRSLDDLHPALKPLAKVFLQRLEDHGIEVMITCTYRSNKEQDMLYAIGRTEDGDIVTNAKGGQSEHNFTIDDHPASKAFDIVPLDKHAMIWDQNASVWKIISKIWSYGFKSADGKYYLDWYGKEGAKFREYCHFCLKESK